MPAETAVLKEQFDDLDQQHAADTLGMWLFLATEVLIFGGLITGYFAYRVWYSYDFEAVSAKLNVLIGGINTVVLLTSSLTMALSVYFARQGRRGPLTVCLALTAALGVAFLALKAVEYYGDYLDGLVPRAATFRPEEWADRDPPVSPARVELFLMFYYVATGLHAVHLTVGVGLVLWLAVRAWRGRLPAGKYMDVDVTGLYWHFVDVVWIFLLPLLYLIGTHKLQDLHFL